MQVTKQYKVMILNNPLDKWGKKNRATMTDPIVVTGDKKIGNVLMISKLRKILRDYGERVSIDNSLTLDILEAYVKKSRKLRAAEKEIAKLKKELGKE